MVKIIKKLKELVSGRAASAEEINVRHLEAGLPATPYRVLITSAILQGSTGDVEERPQRQGQERWTARKLGAFATSAIVSELGRLGIPVDERTFIAAAADTHSAWDLSRPHRKRAGLGGHDDDFAGLAFCELWKRWVQRPCVELVDDHVENGVFHEVHGREAESLEAYQRAWATVCALPRWLALKDDRDHFGVEDWGWSLVTTLDRRGRTADADAFVREIEGHLGVDAAEAMQEAREAARDAELDMDPPSPPNPLDDAIAAIVASASGRRSQSAAANTKG